MDRCWIALLNCDFIPCANLKSSWPALVVRTAVNQHHFWLCFCSAVPSVRHDRWISLPASQELISAPRCFVLKMCWCWVFPAKTGRDTLYHINGLFVISNKFPGVVCLSFFFIRKIENLCGIPLVSWSWYSNITVRGGIGKREQVERYT